MRARARPAGLGAVEAFTILLAGLLIGLALGAGLAVLEFWLEHWL